jgi:hypothetical protein
MVGHSFARHWQVRQMGWVAVGLLAVCVFGVGLLTAQHRWWLGDRKFRGTRMTVRELSATLLLPGRYEHPGLAREPPAPFDPTRNSLTSLLYSIPHAVMTSEQFQRDWAVMNFTRWVVIGTYLGFVLPLFTLAYASGAIGTEREGRTLVWLLTRPVPRSAVYLAELLGTVPWCLLFGVGGFVLLCAVGGEPGREALRLFWPAAIAGSVAFAALFHLIGAVFRRPVVVGLVYTFFFEMLVVTLPGSLKLLSLSFYVRCLVYNRARDAGYPTDQLDVSTVVAAPTAWVVLAAATVVLTVLGMWVFARAEHRDDV